LTGELDWSGIAPCGNDNLTMEVRNVVVDGDFVLLKREIY